MLVPGRRRRVVLARPTSRTSCRPLVLAALGHVAWWGRRARRDDAGRRNGGARRRVLWVPPVVDQLADGAGQHPQLIGQLAPRPSRRSAGGRGPPDARPPRCVGRLRPVKLTETGRFVAPASTWRGALVVALWAVAAVVASASVGVHCHRLHVVVGAALVLGALSMRTHLGKPWYYLTLWAWGITGGDARCDRVVRRRPDPPPAQPGEPGERRTPSTTWRWSALLGGAVAVVSLATAVSFADARCPRFASARRCGHWPRPRGHGGSGVGAADGPDQPYQVRWSDAADIGSPGFGLLAALDRDGLDVAADPYFHVPVTDHRGSARVDRPDPAGDRQLHRRVAPRARRRRGGHVAGAPSASGSSSPLPVGGCSSACRRRVSTTSCGSSTPTCSVPPSIHGCRQDDQADFTRLLDLGQPMAVFIAPVDAEPAPPA